MADTIGELHEFASNYGIKRCWFGANPKHPHYDLLGSNLELVLSVLAPISTKEMLKKVRNASN